MQTYKSTPRQYQQQGVKPNTPYKFEDFQTSQSYLIDATKYRRVNSPGLPDTSLRKSTRIDVADRNYLTLGQLNLTMVKRSISPTNKNMDFFKPEIGLISDRTKVIQESPEQILKKNHGYYVSQPIGQQKSEESINLHSFNPQQYMHLDKEVQVTDIPEPLYKAPQMQQQEKPIFKKNMTIVDKIETDKMSLEIFMSDQDENHVMFTGFTKKKLQSPEVNKRIIMQNLQQLFNQQQNDSKTNETQDSKMQHYIKMESLEQSMFQSYKNSNKAIENESTVNPLVSDYMSVSSAQSLKQRNSRVQQVIPRVQTQKQLPKKKQEWNFSKHPPKPKAKESSSPFLKTTSRQTQKNVYSSQPVTAQKKTPKSLHQTAKQQLGTKIKSFHITPEKIPDSCYDERFYQ